MHVAKAKAKEYCKLTRKQSIEHAAQFKHVDMVWEDDFNATPCPVFTPKLQLPPQNQSKMTPLPETGDLEMSHGSDFDGDFDRAPFIPPRTAGSSATMDNSAVKSNPPPPAKEVKATVKGKAKVMKKSKAASKEKTAEESEVEVVEPKAEPPKEPKVKKKNFQDEINIAAKELEEAQAKKFGHIVKSMQGEEEPAGSVSMVMTNAFQKRLNYDAKKISQNR